MYYELDFHIYYLFVVQRPQNKSFIFIIAFRTLTLVYRASQKTKKKKNYEYCDRYLMENFDEKLSRNVNDYLIRT
jgi:hypothetical protein